MKNLESHIRNYEIATRHLAGAVTIDAYEEMVAGLLSRDSLEGQPGLAGRLRFLDAAFVEALAATSQRWLLEVMRITASFADAPWWQSIIRAATEESAELQKAS
jgi:hypothetical protein